MAPQFPIPPDDPAKKIDKDSFLENPFIHFMISEIWAGIAGVVVYLVFRIGAFLTETIVERIPLREASAANFLEQTLSWGAAIGASGTFALVTLYQIVVLVKRLWARS